MQSFIRTIDDVDDEHLKYFRYKNIDSASNIIDQWDSTVEKSALRRPIVEVIPFPLNYCKASPHF